MTPQVKKFRRKLAYIDLFCGPGVYENGTKSTPLRLLELAITNDDLREMLITVFNDKSSIFIKRLNEEVSKLPNLSSLKYAPDIRNSSVGENLANEFKKLSLIPSFIFIDPWGYKGISIDLIISVVKDWGCDCLLFFNYNRINAAINNPVMRDNISRIFGENRADALRLKIRKIRPKIREIEILNAFHEALNEQINLYKVHYKFYNEIGKTSHFLVFVSKNVLGYKLMKEVMYEESQIIYDDIANYEFNPRLVGAKMERRLFSPILDLEEDLISCFKGCTKKMNEIYTCHNVGTPYIEKNYKQALLNLEQKGLIETNPPAAKRRIMNGKRTFGENVEVTFK